MTGDHGYLTYVTGKAVGGVRKHGVVVDGDGRGVVVTVDIGGWFVWCRCYPNFVVRK